MAAKIKSCTVEDWHALDECIGYPKIVLIDSERALVSTWLSRCFVLNLNSRSSHAESEARPSDLKLPIGNCLVSPSVSVTLPHICAVATRSTWASVWPLGGSESTTIRPETCASVNTVSIRPAGDRVALGIGYYPLDPNGESKAFVELWSMEDQPQCLAARRLPGVAVDRLVWDAAGETLLVATGARSQDRGHVAMLDAASLTIMDIAATEAVFCDALHFDAIANRVFVCTRHCLEMRRADDLGTIERSWNLDDEVHGAAFSTDEAFLTSGLRLDLWSTDRRQLPKLPDCTGVALLPDGTGVGVSRSGDVRIWRENNQ